MRFNRKRLIIVTQPTEYPVSVDDMKTLLRVDGTSDDGLIELYIASATDAAEKYCRTSFVTKTVKLTMDGFRESGEDEIARLGNGVFDYPAGHFLGVYDIDLPFGPVQSVSSVVTYDKANNQTTFDSSNYVVDTAGDIIFLNEGATWPTELRDRAAVEVTYIVGYGAAASVPAAIKQGIREHVRKMYESGGQCDMGETCRCIFDGYKRYDSLGFM